MASAISAARKRFMSMTTSLVVSEVRSRGSAALSDLRSPDVFGRLGKAKPRGLFGIDCGHVETLPSQRGLIKPSKRAGTDQPQRSKRSMPVHRIGELASD